MMSRRPDLRRALLALASAAVLVLPAGPAGAARAQARPMELADLAKLVRVADPQISPDARSVAVLVSRPNYELNRYDTELVLIDVATGAQRGLVAGRRGLAQPQWSPTGDRLAFLAQRQVFVLPIAGGEARQITRAPSGVLRFAWRPDGAEIAIATPDEPEPRSGEERHNDSFEVGNDDYLTSAPPRPAHIWLVPVADSDTSPSFRRLTSGAWSIATSLSASPLSWSPDGRALVFVRFSSPHSGDTDSSTVQVVEVATGNIRSLTARQARESGPAWSPDGARIAFSYPLAGDPANLDEVQVVPAAGWGERVATAGAVDGDGNRVTRTLDRHITEAVWLPDGRSLLVAGNDGTRGAAWIQPLAGPARRLTLGDVVAASGFTLAPSGAVAFVGSEPCRPPEVYFLSAPGGGAAPRRLTDFNREVAALALGRTEVIEWPGGGGGGG
ncbi:MAG: TolB family protein, partial [Gemmatimonadales bacterium]